MAFKTIAIIIGVSKYHDSDIDDLPAAKSDAVFFAQSLRNWGVDEENIYLYLDDEATREAIQECFSSLKEESNLFKLVFYFCGHGLRLTSTHPESYLLFNQSKLNLDRLLQEINSLNAKGIYLFIDACSLRINTLVNPKLEKEIQNKEGIHKNLFCILSSGIEQSYEDIEGEYGYFTRALLRGLSEVRNGKNSPTYLLEKICTELRNKELPLPEMYNIETLRVDFLPSLSAGTKRLPLMAQIQDLVVQNPKKILCLIGEKGVGKTTFCKQLVSAEFHIFYEKDPLILGDASSCALVFLDLSPSRDLNSLHSLVASLLEKKGQFILICRRSFRNQLNERLANILYDFEIQPPGVNEIEAFVQASKLDPNSKELMYLMAGGNPQKIQQMVESYSKQLDSQQDQLEVKRAIAAIAACGSYLNEELFSRVHQLKPNILAFIERMGLLYHSNSGWIPHECLLDIAESEALPIDSASAIEYWCQQITETPNDIEVSKSLIVTITCFGYSKQVDEYIKRAFVNLELNKEEYLDYFDEGAEIFISNGVVSNSSLFLTDVFMNLGQINRAEALLDVPIADAKFIIEVKMRKSQCLWRKGAFQESKRELSVLIDVLPKGDNWIQSLLNRGIACFFLGDWEEAAQDFSTIIKKSKNLQYLGWANCMLGSILGLRAIDKERGRKCLELGIQMLVKKEDFSGAWVGWNNLGELLWKLSEFRPSAFHLQKALEVANNPSMRLETLRNLLELNLRKEGSNSKAVDQILREMESSDFDQIEPYEQMQLFNSLAFAYLLRGEIREAKKYIKKTIPYTASNSEYHLYTLSNLALLFKAFGLTLKADLFFARAISIAKKRKHYLALEQIVNNLQLFEEQVQKKFTHHFSTSSIPTSCIKF